MWPSSILLGGSDSRARQEPKYKLGSDSSPSLPFPFRTFPCPALLLCVCPPPASPQSLSLAHLPPLSRPHIATADLPFRCAWLQNHLQEARDLSCSPELSSLPPSLCQTGQPGQCFPRVQCYAGQVITGSQFSPFPSVFLWHGRERAPLVALPASYPWGLSAEIAHPCRVWSSYF